MEDEIKSYDYRPDFKFFKTGKEKKEEKDLYVGFELEIESNTYDCEDLISDINDIVNDDELFVYYKNDGSLNYGMEIVSMPFTLDYIKENSYKIKRMLMFLTENGCNSHDPGTCGLHFHINKRYFGNNSEEIEKNIDKLILFTEYYKENLIKFSRRNEFGYCRFLGDQRYMNEKDRINILKIKKEKFNADRYMVVNIENHDTVEFRLIRGTLVFETFMASLEFIFNLSRTIKNKEISDISWDDVIKYNDSEYCLNYCKTRKIKSIRSKMKDYSLQYLKQQNKMKKDLIKIENELLVKTYELLIKNTKKIPNNYLNTLKNIPEKYSKKINVTLLMEKFKKSNALILINQYLIDMLIAYKSSKITYLGSIEYFRELLANNKNLEKEIKKVDNEFLNIFNGKYKKYKEIKKKIEI